MHRHETHCTVFTFRHVVLCEKHTVKVLKVTQQWRVHNCTCAFMYAAGREMLFDLETKQRHEEQTVRWCLVTCLLPSWLIFMSEKSVRVSVCARVLATGITWLRWYTNMTLKRKTKPSKHCDWNNQCFKIVAKTIWQQCCCRTSFFKWNK